MTPPTTGTTSTATWCRRTSHPPPSASRRGIPSRGYGYIADGAYFGAVNTAEATGQIVGLPDLVHLVPADAGRPVRRRCAARATWEGGIACADTHGVVTDYWNSTIRFTADAADPGGFTWKVVDQGAVPTGSSAPVGLWVGIGLLVVASGAAAYALRLRRSARAGTGTSGDGPTGDGPGTGPEAPSPVTPTGRT